MQAATSRPDRGTEALSSERSKSEPCRNPAFPTIAERFRSAEREKYVARYLNLCGELPRCISDAVRCTPMRDCMERVSSAATVDHVSGTQPERLSVRIVDGLETTMLVRSDGYLAACAVPTYPGRRPRPSWQPRAGRPDPMSNDQGARAPTYARRPPHDPVPLYPVATEIIAEWPAGTFIENFAAACDGSAWLVTITSHHRVDKVHADGRHGLLADLRNPSHRHRRPPHRHLSDQRALGS